jgi:hypothetical protein
MIRRKLMSAAMCAFYPSKGGYPGLDQMEMEAFLQQVKREIPRTVWLGMVAGTAVFTVSPILTIGVPLPSYMLPKRLLDRHANNSANHPIYLLRQSTLLLKMAGSLHWGADNRVRAMNNLPPYPKDPGTWRTS